MVSSLFGPAPSSSGYVAPPAPLSATQKVVRAIFIALASVFAVGAISGVYLLAIPSLICALIALGIRSLSGGSSYAYAAPAVPVYHAPSPIFMPPPVFHAPPPVYHAPPPVFHAPPPVFHTPPPASMPGFIHRGYGASHGSSHGGRPFTGHGAPHAVPPADMRGAPPHPSGNAHGGFRAAKKR